MESKVLRYEDFGAVGNGVADDFDAIIACHAEANRTGATVKLTDGAKYYIKKIATAEIKTDVDFGTAEFIIDDSELSIERRGPSIFVVASDYENVDIDIKSYSKEQKKLEFEHTGNAYVRLINENKPIFIRKGLNKNSGKPTSDCLLVDGEGNVKVGANYDYTEITKAYYKCADDKPLTIKGGKFTTVANRAESFYNYYGRNFNIKRSNVTVEGLTHLIRGELDHGAPYAGFLCINECVNVTVKNCLLTPHFIYWTPSKEPGKLVPMGSYDINLSACINCMVENITQSVDIYDNKYWGLIHTNFCKNLTVENCVMSRYDAHEGVTNVTLKNCTFGHQRVNLIGYGEAFIEDCTMTGPNIFALRGDYGSFWCGNVTVKNCTFNAQGKASISTINASNNGDHDFGYECAMPSTYTLDGLTINDEQLSSDANIYILPNYDSTYAEGNKPYPYVPTKKLVIKNVKTTSGRACKIAEYPDQYKELEIIEG